MTVAAARDHIARQVEELQRQVYELRRQIASGVELEALPEGELDVLRCRVGDNQAAFLQESVEEVVMMARLTPVPEAPSWAPGLLNLRGTMAPVVDVVARIGREVRRPALSDRIVVCSIDGRRVGLIVQEVLGVDRCETADVEPPPQDIPCAPYLLGVLHGDGTPIMLLSVACLVATSDLPENGA